MNKTDELRTARIGSLITPASLAAEHPVSPAIATMSPLPVNVLPVF